MIKVTKKKRRSKFRSFHIDGKVFKFKIHGKSSVKLRKDTDFYILTPENKKIICGEKYNNWLLKKIDEMIELKNNNRQFNYVNEHSPGTVKQFFLENYFN